MRRVQPGRIILAVVASITLGLAMSAAWGLFLVGVLSAAPATGLRGLLTAISLVGKNVAREASATLSAGWSGKQDFLRAVGGGETAINNGMITRPPKDDRLSGLVLECLLARKCRVGRMQLFVHKPHGDLGRPRKRGAAIALDDPEMRICCGHGGTETNVLDFIWHRKL